MIDLLVEQINKNPDRVKNFLIDNTNLKTGIYLKVDIDTAFDATNFKDYIIIGPDYKKTKNFKSELDMEQRLSLFRYFRDRDYLSGLLDDDANKTIDGNTKKVLSTVFLTTSFANKFSPFNTASKEKSKFASVDGMLKLLNTKMFDNYINIGSKIEDTLQIKKLKAADESVLNIIKKANNPTRIAKINLCREYLNANLGDILRFAESKNLGNVKIKLFFSSKSNSIDDSVECYEDEYTFYLSKYLFNLKSTKIIDNDICGIISYGFNNNDTKPLLKPLGMRIDNVNMFNMSKALDIKIAFDLLNTISSNNSARWISFDNISDLEQFSCDIEKLTKFDFQQKALYFKLNYKEKYIEDYDLIPESYKEDSVLGNEKITIKNYLEPNLALQKKKATSTENKKHNNTFTIKTLLSIIVHCFTDSLNKYSDYAMCNTAGNLFSPSFEKTFSLLFERNKFEIHDFLTQKISRVNTFTVENVIDKFTLDCIVSFSKFLGKDIAWLYEIKKMLNIRLNLLNKFNIRREDFMLLEKFQDLDLKNDKITIANDSEYYFIVGQLAYYIEMQKKGDFTSDCFKFYTDKRTIDTLKRYLISRFESYSYSINARYKNFYKVLSNICEYVPKSNIQDNIINFYYGVSSENILLKKSKADTDNKIEE